VAVLADGRIDPLRGIDAEPGGGRTHLRARPNTTRRRPQTARGRPAWRASQTRRHDRDQTWRRSLPRSPAKLRVPIASPRGHPRRRARPATREWVLQVPPRPASTAIPSNTGKLAAAAIARARRLPSHCPRQQRILTPALSQQARRQLQQATAAGERRVDQPDSVYERRSSAAMNGRSGYRT